MSRQRFRASMAKVSQETLHPKLRFFFPLGDAIEEPFAFGGYYATGPTGTVITGQRGKARELSAGMNVPLYNVAPNSSQILLRMPWTAMFFINFSSPSPYARLFHGNTNGTFIELTTSIIKFVRNGVTLASKSVSLNVNTWYHVAISVGTTTGSWKMYLNGSYLSPDANGDPDDLGYSGTSTSSITIYLVNNSPTIRLDQVKVYGAQLSDAEIVSEMNKQYF